MGHASIHPVKRATRRAILAILRRGSMIPVLVAAVVLAAGVGGCASPSPGASGATASPPPATVADLATRLTQAVSAGDRAGFDALFADAAGLPAQSMSSAVASAPDGEASALASAVPSGSPSPVPTAASGRRDLLWNNLRGLASVQFEPGSEPGTLRVGWTVGPEDLAPAWQLVAGVVCDASACGVRNLAPVSGSPAPLWVAQSITVTTDPAGVTIVGDSGASEWMDAARQAVSAVAAADLNGLDDPGAATPSLVVEVPDSFTAFQAVLGQDGADFIGTGAFTWVEDTAAPSLQASSPLPTASPGAAGWQAPDGAVRVVVNPTSTSGLDASERAALLAHEAVHVATIGHPVAPGRRWVSEGMAEVVGLSLDASMAAQSTTDAAAACTSDGLAPPTDESFGGGDAVSQQTSYAVAWELLTLLRAADDRAQASQDIVALWGGAPVSGQVLTQLKALSAAWCASR